MNDIINTFLLAGDKFMSEMHLKQPGFTYIACGSFTKNKQRIQRFMEAGDTKYIYRNELDNACFQHDMAYKAFKDLKRRTQSDEVLKDKAFAIASNPKYGYQRGFASMVCKFFDKKSKGSGVKNEIKENQQLVLICMVHLTVCSYHVMYAFQSEFILYSCLNVKEVLAQSRREI